MSRYIYSIVRCLPDPRTGEFMNVGAVVGDPVTGDWAIRQLSNTDRVRKFAGAAAFGAASDFIFNVGSEIDLSRQALEEGCEPLSENWLARLHHDHRNVVQLSPPTPMVAQSARQALDLIFDKMIIDRAAESRQPPVTKYHLGRDLREAYRRADIADELVRTRAKIYVGSRVHYDLDFAIANGQAVQLTQIWSFKRKELDDVSLQVKAWGYAMERLRDGDGARVEDSQGHRSTVDQNVDLQVVVALPETPEQGEVYQEAQEIFGNLNAGVHPVEEVQAVGMRAAELLRQRL
ncbi:hypothetical protein GCM10009555_039870 [Acrocarpospora macrocephala]|uniref:DUF3037 domain-containing protein n=1 Tax=Acrocarpospora macrocephala TaxID=150177 RepID=A0A5M3WPD9_9ACTN|nr:DUF3037 domain-containing protein [Acrocarpospora macrocephala]GES10039.1 hypothetical protein Amac_036360 [Acrocarpospora macrocephala]